MRDLPAGGHDLRPQLPGDRAGSALPSALGNRDQLFRAETTILGGRVLRARTPHGIDQEVYALLVTYQALRIADADAVADQPDLDPDRASFTIALSTARAQLTAAGGILTHCLDLIGVIGVIARRVLAALLPARRARTSPRVVKPAISNYTVKTSQNRVRGPSRHYNHRDQHASPDSPLTTAHRP